MITMITMFSPTNIVAGAICYVDIGPKAWHPQFINDNIMLSTLPTNIIAGAIYYQQAWLYGAI